MAFNLGDKDFQTNTIKTFKELWNDQDFTDVTLVTGDDKLVSAHKIILGSSSVFFKNYLGNIHIIVLSFI